MVDVKSQSDQVHDALEKSRKDLYHARHLPGEIYFSQDIFDLEKACIWMKEWLCVGRVEQLPNPGDYKAMRIVGEPIVVVRGEDQKLRAMANVCRHRGVEVATYGTGNAKEFSCPYHGWLYDLEGKLIGAPFRKELEQAGTFDFKNCKLPELKLDTWGGYIFINFDENSIGLPEYMKGTGTDQAEELRSEDTRVCDVYTFQLDCNWKLVPENFMDIYHAKAIHGESFAKHFVMEGFGFELEAGGRYRATYQSNTMAPDGQLLFGPMPWLADKPDDFAFTFYMRPNMNFFARKDLIQPAVAYPIDAETTEVSVYTQFPEEFFDLPAFEEKSQIHKDFIRLVLAEDAAMMRSLQNGVRSRNFMPGPTVHLEKAIHHILQYWMDRIYGPEQPAIAAE